MRYLKFLFFLVCFAVSGNASAQNQSISLEPLAGHLQTLEVPKNDDGLYYFRSPDLGDFSMDIEKNHIRELATGHLVTGVRFFQFSGTVASIASFELDNHWILIQSPCKELHHSIYTIFPELSQIKATQIGNVSKWISSDFVIMSTPSETGLKIDIVGDNAKKSHFFRLIEDSSHVTISKRLKNRVVIFLKL